MKFAPLIRDARRRSLLSHDELASAVGVSPKAIWLAEQGAGTLKTLIGVLDQLQVPITGLPPASNLGARVHAARIKRGWSLQKLSERCGLSIPTIRGLEQGRGRIASLEAVIDALAPSARVRRSGKFRRAAPRSVICAQVQKFENADCVEVMRNMECGSVDLVVTRPPYNAGKEYEGNLSVEEYVQFAERWVSEIPRVLTPTGALWLNVGYFKPTENQAVPLGRVVA